MLKSNLSTRPFYNERVVHLWLLLLALVVVAATLFNVTGLVTYSRSDTELGSAATRDENRAAELRAEAARLRGSVDAKQIAAASEQARQANALIDRRTFSWTELLNRFEATLPRDVRITSVRPRVIDQKPTLVTVTVVARSVDDVNEFMEKLEDTGAFANLLSTEDHVNDDEQLEAVLEMNYVPKAAPANAQAPAAAAAPASASEPPPAGDRQ
jgi:Tfp pilus assembly protein PilN